MNPSTDLVMRFLAAMQARDMDAARAMLSPGAVLQFPGAAPMTDLAQVVAWAAPRYRFVRKDHHGADVSADGAVVHCHGTLSGEWPDGTPFAGVRFIDRFEIRDGLIIRQDVWNDIAERKGRP
ncbi:MAG: nuclear transport factor 2 family protein [Paracoccus sp.]|nr:nuclear transport factor 2 family protein [Paracoccus sp. (in: a-proteobacteria)]